MGVTSEPAPTPKIQTSLADTLGVYVRPRVLIVMFLGFASGLPLALSGSTLAVWMRESGVDLGTIGLMALVGTPYTIKFLWAPVVDALPIPYLSRKLGRRRGWLIFSQLLLIAAILFLSGLDPAASPAFIAFGALLVAAAAATQDIVIDAFRVESLDEREQAAGMASFVAAYRVGMLASTAGVLFLVSYFEQELTKPSAWSAGYVAMAGLVGIGMLISLIATEPAATEQETEAETGGTPIRRVMRSAIGAFSEFLQRDLALFTLAFVVLYKFCDAFAGAMTAPFVIDLGFTRNDYAAIVKGVGLAASLIGGFAGGLIARAYPLTTSLWIGAILQTASNLVFAWQALMGVNHAALTLTIIAENFTGAIGTVIFVAYLSALCKSPLHTATQFALLSALSAFGRTYLSSGAGFLAESTGWFWFFVLSALVALPGLVLLAYLQSRGHFEKLGSH